MSSRLSNLSLLAASLVVCIAAAEILARSLLDDGYYVWPPGLSRTAQPDSTVLAGVFGPSRFSVNSLGVRGDEPTGSESVRILALGGSTTISVYLDDEETWAHLLQERLNDALGAGTVWVGNAGRSGHATTQHRLQAEKLLATLPDVELVLMLVGVNDMLVRAGWKLEGTGPGSGAAGTLPPGAHGEDALRRAFSVIPLSAEPGHWYRRTGLARLWARARTPRAQGPTQDDTGAFIRYGREMRRQAAEFVEAIPDLSQLVDDYSRKLGTVADVVEAAGVQLVLLTQPVLWSRGLSEEGRDRLMFGGPPLDRSRPGARYYSVEALADGMAAYNAALLRLCEKRNLSCIDLVSSLPPDTALFTDDVHYTEEGSRRIAFAVASHLLRGPLRGQYEEGSGKAGRPVAETAAGNLLLGAVSAVSFGDSYAVRQARPIEDRLGIPTLAIAEAASSAGQWLKRYEEWAPLVAALDGPVVVFLSVGSNDERANPPFRLSAFDTAASAKRLIHWLLVLRSDLTIIQTGYNGECAEVEFQNFLPARTDRYLYVETMQLDQRIEFEDSCHPDPSGFAERIRYVTRQW